MVVSSVPVSRKFRTEGSCLLMTGLAFVFTLVDLGILALGFAAAGFAIIALDEVSDRRSPVK